MEISENKSYIFKKSYKGPQGQISEGSTINYVHGCVYFNGGLCSQSIGNMLMQFISNDKLRNEYIEVHNVIYNKV